MMYSYSSTSNCKVSAFVFLIGLCLLVTPTTCQYYDDYASAGSASGMGNGSGDPFIYDNPFTDQPSTTPTDQEPTLEPLNEGSTFIEFIDITTSFTGRLTGTDDGCSEVIFTNQGIPFGTGTYTFFYVCANGLITVGSPPIRLYEPELFPSNSFRVSQSNILAPFWNDNDIRNSSVFYRIFREDERDVDVSRELAYVSSFVSNSEKVDFFGTWMLVVLWQEVPPFPYFADRPANNTYEAILITDGILSYAVYTYNCDTINWGRSQTGIYSTIGYNINPDFTNITIFPSFENHLLSRLSIVTTVGCVNEPRGVPWSNLVYKVGESADAEQLARHECIRLVANDTGEVFREVPQIALERCPCTEGQAAGDARFRFLDLLRITGKAVYARNRCYIQANAPIRWPVICCYAVERGAQEPLTNVEGLSTPVQYNPRRNPREFIEFDENLRSKCSEGSIIEEAYRIIRPPANCTRYISPELTWCVGDPHLTTLDGGSFTFNGWGEYLVVKFSTAMTQFRLQTRTEPVNGSNATQLVAVAFAMILDSPVEVRLNSSTQQMEILISSVDSTAELSNTNDFIETDFLYIVRTSPTSVFASFPNGMGVTISLSSMATMLAFTMIVPEAFRELTCGMLGNYNGMVEDDVIFRNGTVVEGTPTDRIIHEVGQSWQLLDGESLFTYPGNLTYEDFAHPDHIPAFLEDVLASAPEDVIDACGSNVECIYDACQTEEISVGIETMEVIATNFRAQAIQSNMPPTITGPSSLFITVGVEATLAFNVTDDKNNNISVTVVNELPNGATLTPSSYDNYTTYTFSWTLTEVVNRSLVFIATDEAGAASMLGVQLMVCGCQNGGNCTLDGILGLSASTIILNCQCLEGWEGSFCEVDEDGCSNFMCHEGVQCTDVPAPGVGASCGSCPVGYEGDGEKCNDIDECSSNSHNCADVCINSPGSFRCDCSLGFQQVNATHCEDIDECLQMNGGCHHVCLNSEGSFACSCNDGFMLTADNRTCDVDAGFECNPGNNCTDLCTLIMGAEKCDCFPGYELALDNISCININECEQTPCGQNCIDLDGSFQCSCFDGYDLLSDGTCQDVNECLDAALNGMNLCGQSMICVNTDGNYSCQCPLGAELTGNQCVAISATVVTPTVAQGCGNGTIDLMESCDDNNTMSGDGCNSTCQMEPGFMCIGEPSVCVSVCGDGVIVLNEACDDNNANSGDGCNSTCQIEPGYSCFNIPSICVEICGDGLLVGNEDCDDKNNVTGDGCSDACVTEFGFDCNGSPSICSSQCGDGLAASDEACDDGDIVSGNGCSASCEVERGYTCDNSVSPSECTGICGDGIKLSGEDCDDGARNETGDGCTDDCKIEPNFVCLEDMSGLSICTAVLLDLNVPDNTTLDYTDEYLDLNDIVFLFDPNNTNFSSFFVSVLGQAWSSVAIVVLNGVDPISNEADIFVEQALAENRLPAGIGVGDVRFVRRQVFMDDSRLEGLGLNTSDVVEGMIINGDSSSSVGGGDELLDAIEIEVALMSLGFIANEHPGYGPREVCIVARDGVYNTTACVTLFFIGRNDDEPTVTYTPNSVVQFVEGQSDFIPIVDGSLVVTDPDHPTRYLMKSAYVSIDGFTPNSLEQLSVTYQHPDFNYNYDWNTGVLTISGEASTELYSEILSNLTYHNNMTEPLDSTRTIEVVVNDGNFTSRPAEIVVEIVNVNDPPVVSLDRVAPDVVFERSVAYSERDGERRLVSRLVVIDTDPGAMIQRATVTLVNPIDLVFESIAISANLSDTPLSLYSSPYQVQITGVATQEMYTSVLRSLTYSHSDANPGNPTQLPARELLFEVEDETNATSARISVLTINILPLNDAPILSIVSDPTQRSGPLVLNGPTEAIFMYLEDDPPLSIGADVYLRDVDSNISSVNIYATGLVDGSQDRLFFPALYGITVMEMELGGGNRTITLTGDFSPSLYEKVLRSFSYQNTYTNNSVTDGRRTVSMVVADSAGVSSGYILVHIDIMDRNDGPQINVGQGVNMDHIIRFVENGDSIPITQTFLTSLGDEEGHNISRMTVSLSALNGQLDENEFIFFRTPGGVEFLDHLDTPLTTTYISISVNSSVRIYEQALTSIFYINDQPEPSIYNSTNGTDRLMRVITIQITDTNYIDPTADPAVTSDADMGTSTTTVLIGIEITPINDNKPRILIRSDPDSCSTDSDDNADSGAAMARRRRDIRSVSRVTKKSIMLNSRKNPIESMSPRVASATPSFSNSTNPSKQCLRSITLNFNTDTSTPMVEIPTRFSDLISLDPPELDIAEKFGIWLDYQTLVIHFIGECMEIEVETTSGKIRPMFVVFEAEQGDCNWDTPCRQGICFQNKTGCPLISYTPITINNKVPPINSSTTETPSPDSLHHTLIRLLLVVGVSAVFMLVNLSLFICCILVFRNRRQSTAAIKQEKSLRTEERVKDLVIVTLGSKKAPLNKASPSKFSEPQKSTHSSSSELSDKESEQKRLVEKRSSDSKKFGTPSSHLKSKELPPQRKGEKELPRAKRKPPLPENSQETAELSASNTGVVTPCDQSHDHQSSVRVGGSVPAQSLITSEQSIDNSHLHPRRTTSSESDSSVV